MRITPRVGPERNDPRAEHRRQREVERAQRRRRGGLRRALRARQLRRMRQARRNRAQNLSVKTRNVQSKSVVNANKFRGASRLLFPLAVIEGMIFADEQIRRAQGASGRRIAAEDANTIFGDLDEQITANAEARSVFESSSNVLQWIGREGRMTADMHRLIDDVRSEALHKARGADMLNREPDLDSLDDVWDVAMATLGPKIDEIVYELKGLSPFFLLKRWAFGEAK